MIKLIGEQLYQWDTGRSVEITSADVNEVHFSNCRRSEALVVEAIVTENLITAPIPNILLQENQPIRTYAVIKDSLGCEQTVDFGRLEITERERPADYVYTEVEIKNYDALEARIKALEENGGGSGGSVDLTEIEADIEELQSEVGKLSEDIEELKQNAPSGEGGASLDVQINGTSIVADGVANIPIASNTQLGVGKTLSHAYGIGVSDDIFRTVCATESDISAKGSAYKPIVPKHLDYAVKTAMCDGKGAEWTSEEKASARDRMGINTWLFRDDDYRA